MHTLRYFRYVYNKLSAAMLNGNGACDYGEAARVMREMRQEIETLGRQGKFPQA